MSITIRILKGEGLDKPRDLVLDKTTILIGRGSTQDVQLTNDSVSRRHTVVEQDGGRWFLIDEGGVNTTILNGSKVAEGKHPLHHADVLEIGEVMLQIGIDKELSEDSLPIAQEVQVSHSVRIVKVVLTLIGLLVIGSVCNFLYKSNNYVSGMTKELSLALSDEKSYPIFYDEQERNINYALPAGWEHANEGRVDYPEPEWNLGDVWSTSLKGREPRLFDGMDLSLRGGDQVCVSHYFYVNKMFWTHDANDPYGLLYFSIEGWAGMGDRVGVEEIPTVRSPEMPHYLRNITIYPQNVQPYTKAGHAGGEVATFTYTKFMDPTRLPVGLEYPKNRRFLAGRILPELKAADVPMEGKHYSFFHDGGRYTAVVRGSSNLLARFPGGLDALADAFFSSISFSDPVRSGTIMSADEIQAKVKEQQILALALDRKVRILGSIRYADLLEMRKTVLQFQGLAEESPFEKPFVRDYFEIRDKVQKELHDAAKMIHSSKGMKEPKAAERELVRIQTFLGDYPPPTLKPGNHGYPEWARYYSAVMKQRPYDRR